VLERWMPSIAVALPQIELMPVMADASQPPSSQRCRPFTPAMMLPRGFSAAAASSMARATVATVAPMFDAPISRSMRATLQPVTSPDVVVSSVTAANAPIVVPRASRPDSLAAPRS
jgi:hypothetical protein